MSTTSMQTFEFTVILAGVEVATLDDGDRLAAAGCDDGTFGSRDGLAFIEFDREADSLDGAIRSAIHDVQIAGFQVQRVVYDEFETIARFNAQLAGA